MKIYMAVENDELSLPLAIADCVLEMAKIINVKPETIYCAITKKHYVNSKFGKTNILKIDIGDIEI